MSLKCLLKITETSFLLFGTIWAFLGPDSDLDSESVFLAPVVHSHNFIFAGAKRSFATLHNLNPRVFKYCLMLSLIFNSEAVNCIYFSVCSFLPTQKSCAGTRTTYTWSTESSTMYPGSFRKPWRRIQRFNNIFIDTSHKRTVSLGLYRNRNQLV